ncbi:MAG TPA: cation diffusion facilitator family transporter [Mycobacteriales bacterium]|nr:cation diffusion facilitator family transporter [Mycobacteriales bacterium]
MAHRHEHGSGDRRLLSAALALLVAFMVVEVTVAVLASSLALLADAGHLLVDALALVMALTAGALALRPANERWTFGLARAEVLSAAVNGITLLVVSAVVTVEAVRRLVHPPDVDGAPLVVVASVGLVVNVIAAALLARADRSSLNIAGAFAHVLTDAYAFAATIVAGVVVLATGFHRADPIASLVVVVLMLRAAWQLLRDSGHVLLEAAPEHVDLAALRVHLLETPHVLDVHDLHVWTSGSRLPSVSAHVVVADDCFSDNRTPALLDELQECLVGHFDVEHSTFQFELAGHTEHEPGAHH